MMKWEKRLIYEGGTRGDNGVILSKGKCRLSIKKHLKLNRVWSQLPGEAREALWLEITKHSTKGNNGLWPGWVERREQRWNLHFTHILELLCSISHSVMSECSISVFILSVCLSFIHTHTHIYTRTHLTNIYTLHRPFNMMPGTRWLTVHLTGPVRFQLTLILSFLTIHHLINLPSTHHSSCPPSISHSFPSFLTFFFH